MIGSCIRLLSSSRECLQEYHVCPKNAKIQLSRNIYFADGTLTADAASIDRDVLQIVETACALSNDVLFFEKLEQANPIDRALISFALKNRVDVRALMQNSQRIYDKPFDAENRYMLCGFALEEGEVYFAKGDPAVILRMCKTYMSVTGELRRMDFDFWSLNLSNMQVINQSGDTVIALAWSSTCPETPVAALTFLCLLQIQNPIQPGACTTVEEITKSGMRTMLLTGDRAETAGRVAVDCGISADVQMSLSGGTINRMELREVAKQSEYCSVFARLVPSQKGLIIRLLQQKGYCVGMVGDGINDGVALRVADVGISFAKDSSPIARRYSDILINDFADLRTLMKSADRLKRRIKHSNTFRISFIILLILGVYIWVFIS